MPAEVLRTKIGRVTPRHALLALWCLAGTGCYRLADETPRTAATGEQAPIAREAALHGSTAKSHVPAIDDEPAVEAGSPINTVDAGMPDSAPSAPVVPPAAEGMPRSADEPSAADTVEPPAPSVFNAKTPAEALEPPAVPAAPAEPEPDGAAGAAAAGAAASSAASPPEAEPLDLKSLATRLRKTKAINLRTKFAVKNESDDLLEAFRAYHAQRGTVTLAELRRSFDALFLKLYSLLEDADPPLARDIDRSRAAIWAVLADPLKFRTTAGTASARSEPSA